MAAYPKQVSFLDLDLFFSEYLSQFGVVSVIHSCPPPRSELHSTGSVLSTVMAPGTVERTLEDRWLPCVLRANSEHVSDVLSTAQGKLRYRGFNPTARGAGVGTQAGCC